MALTRLSDSQIRKLADDIRDKILGSKALISNAKGRISIDIYPKGEGFEVNLTITT